MIWLLARPSFLLLLFWFFLQFSSQRLVRFWRKSSEPPQSEQLLIIAGHLRKIARADHARLTNEDNGTGRSDKTAIAYVRHLGRDSLEHREKMAAKLTGAAPELERRKQKIAARVDPWPKARKMQSRRMRT